MSEVAKVQAEIDAAKSELKAATERVQDAKYTVDDALVGNGEATLEEAEAELADATASVGRLTRKVELLEQKLAPAMKADGSKRILPHCKAMHAAAREAEAAHDELAKLATEMGPLVERYLAARQEMRKAVYLADQIKKETGARGFDLVKTPSLDRESFTGPLHAAIRKVQHDSVIAGQAAARRSMSPPSPPAPSYAR